MFNNKVVSKSIPKQDAQLFERVYNINAMFWEATSNGNWKHLPKHLQRIADISPSCHAIAMAISMLVPEMRTCHGVYVGLTEGEGSDEHNLFLDTHTCAHSWNIAPGGTIIDSYPVGILAGGPVIIASHGLYKSFGAGHYVNRPAVTKKLTMFKHWSMASLIADVVLFAKSKSKEVPN